MQNIHQKGLAKIFNYYILAHVIHALDSLGVFNKLSLSACSIESLTSNIKIDKNKLAYLLNMFCKFGFLKRNDDFYQLTDKGNQLKDNVGFFNWAVGGYGKVFESINKIMLNEPISWTEMRSGAWVAIASDQCNQHLMKDLLFGILDKISFKYMADIGCGNAGRLIDICNRYQSICALGIDVDKQAIEIAQHNVKQNNFVNNIKIQEANVLDCIWQNEIEEDLSRVDIVTCFMMLHDLINSSLGKQSLLKIKASFPNAKYFLFADTVKDPSENEPSAIFSLGFETIHALMNIRLFTKEEYMSFFIESGYVLIKCYDFGVPNTYAFLLGRDS